MPRGPADRPVIRPSARTVDEERFAGQRPIRCPANTGRPLLPCRRMSHRESVGAEEALAIPPLGRRIIESLWFSRWFRKFAKKRAIKSQQRMYQGGFVETYVEGDGQEFDYGIDYIECANCKFLQAENAFEIAPYVCATDKPISELMGWGLYRRTTIADGSPICKFRFKKGGRTQVTIPPSLLTSSTNFKAF